MSAEKIAILTDSCTDTPPTLSKTHPVYTIPLHVNYQEASYLDRVDIFPEDIYARLPEEIPSTSTPSVQEVSDVFEQIEKDGFTHIVCINISSALSGTFNLVEQVSQYFGQLKTSMVDTLNIGFGAGFTVKKACESLDKKMHFDEIVATARAAVKKTHTFFVVDTLDYLYKGGRISKAVYKIGSVLNIKPIITCNAVGEYAVASQGRGKKGAIKKVEHLIQKVTQGKSFDLAVANGNAIEQAASLLASAKSQFPQVKEVIDCGQISPVLTVHTGPGLIGLAVQTD